MKTKTLNLANIEKSDIKYKMTTFPDGEPHIQFEEIDNKYPITVKTRICNPKDFYTLLLATDVLNRWEANYDVFVSYLMGARMDRLMDITRPISYKIVASILTTYTRGRINVFDCHAVKNPRFPFPFFNTTSETNGAIGVLNDNKDLLLFPDHSAMNRYYETLFVEYDKQCPRMTCCDKQRTDCNVTTNISDYSIGLIKESERVIIIDDIIDGGRTISNVIDTVRENAPNVKIHVYASHCVNKEGMIRILQKSDQLTTTNSYKDWQSDTDLKDNQKLKVIEII